MNDFLRKTILVCLLGTQMGSINEKKWRLKILWHCPFNTVRGSTESSLTLSRGALSHA